MKLVDQPSRWKPFRKDSCASCWGSCCTMPVEVKIEDLLRLKLISEDEVSSPKKVFKKLFQQKIVSSYRQGTGFFMLTQKPNDDCYFLDSKTRLCTVYENRPGVCREFPSIGPRPGCCPYIKKN